MRILPKSIEGSVAETVVKFVTSDRPVRKRVKINMVEQSCKAIFVAEISKVDKRSSKKKKRNYPPSMELNVGGAEIISPVV